MYCKHCGKEIADNSNFCQHCGNSLLDEQTSKIEIVDKKQEILSEEINKSDIFDENSLSNGANIDISNGEIVDENSRNSNKYGNLLGITLMTISLMTIIGAILLAIPSMIFLKGNIFGVIVAIVLGSCGYYIGKWIKNR